MNAAQRRKARRAPKPQRQIKLRPYQVEMIKKLKAMPRAFFVIPI